MVLDAIEKLALKHALSDSVGALIKRAYKYYSVTYHTPLHVAYQLIPEYEAVLIYFEDKFEHMDPIALKDTVDVLYPKKNLALLNEGPAAQTEAQTVMDDEAWVTKMNMKLKKQEDAETVKNEAQEVMAAVDQAIAEINKSLQVIKQKADTDA